jgi:gas vesicle structural protein
MTIGGCRDEGQTDRQPRSPAMAVQHATDGPSLIDVLDRVLDKGIVIDAYARVSLVGIDMITIESRVMVASFDTYLTYSTPLRYLPMVAWARGLAGEVHSSARPLMNGEERKPPPSRHSARVARARK